MPAGDGERIPVIWHSILGYRSFQRYVEGEVSLDSYLADLECHLPVDDGRAFPLYGSDWEVFDFKPWRAQPDEFFQPSYGEMDRIAHLLAILQKKPEFQVITPSSVLSRFPDPPPAIIENCEHPLPYKKQDIHSVARWAVGGRDGLRLNTQCHQLYQDLLFIDWHIELNGQTADSSQIKDESAVLWQDLCLLWNSDLRTFTTEDKHLESRNRMGAALYRANRLKESLRPSAMNGRNVWLVNCSPVTASTELASFTVNSNGTPLSPGQVFELQINGRNVPCHVTSAHANSSSGFGSGSIETGANVTMAAVPVLPAGYADIGVIKERTSSLETKSPEAKSPYHSSLDSSPDSPVYSIDRERHIVETGSVRLVLLPHYGGAIQSLAFPSVSNVPLICQPTGPMPSSVRLADNGFSTDLVLEDQHGKRISDHHPTEIQYPSPGESHEIFLPVRCTIHTDAGTIWKTYRVYLDQPRIDLNVRFQWRDVVAKSFRLGRMFINPGAFDRSTLYYATTNGGEMIERFALDGNLVSHDEPVEGGVTNRGCLGATEGWVVLGDATSGVGLVTKLGGLYSVPLIHYEELASDPSRFLLSVVYTLGEGDDTSHTLWRGHSTWNLSILGGAGDLIDETRTSALLANGGLVAYSGAGQSPF